MGRPLSVSGLASRQMGFFCAPGLPKKEECAEILKGIYSGLERFHSRCRPNPDFQWSFVGSPNCMRLSMKKAAHHCPRIVLRCRKSGLETFSWFLSRKTTPHDLHAATVIVKLIQVLL
jgi:hypothetical protein